ncbi:MAG TPA: PQQ-dependent sugar dehydrogenase [Thermoanaerobaculia bacterium]|nr:PQQ-dependent sugar dehydrogenase [Thermoanaerobaculia bacterium]
MRRLPSRWIILLPLVLFVLALAPVPFNPEAPGPALPVALQRVVTGLESPVSIAHAGDARLFVNLQDGRIVIVVNGALRSEPFLDIRSLVSSGGERGLLGLAFHPRYAQNGRFFVYYTDRNGDVVIARYQVSGDPNRADAGSGRILIKIPQPFGNHNGGPLQFGPDGYLYAGVGDGGSGGDPSCFAQKTDTLLGKILRIDVDANADAPPWYGIPASNPIPGREIWASGLRNPWRISFDRLTGDLWIGDVGQNEIEEIDLQPAGAGGRNYGWKPMEGSSCFSTAACPVGTPPCNSPAYTLPVLEYRHGAGDCSVTGGYVSRSRTLPHAWGAYFFGDLCSGRLWAAERRGASRAVRRLPERAQQVTTFGEDQAGDLYLATHDGNLFRLVPENPVDTVGVFVPGSSLFLFNDLHESDTADRQLRFGPPDSGWIPLAGDWDGDGRTTIGFWDPDARTFRLKNTLRRGPADLVFSIGRAAARDIPLAGDWNGDGRDSVGFYSPATATFRLTNRQSSGRLEISFSFGPANAQPIVGDWDGDGRDTVGVYVPGTGRFLLTNDLAAGPADFRFRFGPQSPGWIALAGDWDGDGRDGAGVFDPSTGVFRLKNALRAGAADHTLTFGGPGLPLAGEW